MADLAPQQLSRQTQLDRLVDAKLDLAIIGGGATGVGLAVDAASRGFQVGLFERGDFGQGTSSRSTKLVHGGVRYLQQGNVSLVREALHERGLLLRNAPHVVQPLPTVVPLYQWWEGPYYAAGLKAYDLLAGKLGMAASRWWGRDETLAQMPTLNPQGLRGGVCYLDAQFDDTRLLVHLVQLAISHGAACLNYAPVRELTQHAGKLTGLVAEDLETDTALRVQAKVVVNCAGPYSDAIRQMQDPSAPRWIAASQGTHVVLPQRFMPGGHAMMVPQTQDGRVVFAIPWLGRTLVGTTDTALDRTPDQPTALASEIDYLLATVAPFLSLAPSHSDVLSVFAGVRPLVQADPNAATSKLSRDHQLRVSESGLLSVLGGKWTTYRRMAEDAMDRAIELGGLQKKPCVTHHMPIPNPAAEVPPVDDPHQVQRAVQWELARTVEDVLSRRTRQLLRDAGAAITAAPEVARLLAKALDKDDAWQAKQVASFQHLAASYQVPS